MIHIITPCSRPENLSILKSNIEQVKKESKHDILWHICFDSRIVKNVSFILDDWIRLYTAGTYEIVNPGKSQINFVLTHFKLGLFEGYIYVLDDDNIIPDRLFDYNYQPLESLIYLFPRIDNDVLHAVDPRIDRIDQGQFLCHSSIQEFYPLKYNGDSEVIQALCSQHSYKVIDTPVYYNYLIKQVLV